jgi:hypothetical protein
VVDEIRQARASRPDRHLEGVEGELGTEIRQDPPADDRPAEDVDDEGGVDEARPGPDVGQIGDPQPVRRGRGGPRSTRSAGRWLTGPGRVVRIRLVRVTPGTLVLRGTRSDGDPCIISSTNHTAPPTVGNRPVTNGWRSHGLRPQHHCSRTSFAIRWHPRLTSRPVDRELGRTATANTQAAVVHPLLGHQVLVVVAKGLASRRGWEGLLEFCYCRYRNRRSRRPVRYSGDSGRPTKRGMETDCDGLVRG